MIPQITTYETSFFVLPKHTNYVMGETFCDMICGGVLLYEMDLAAAAACRRCLYAVNKETKETIAACLTAGVKDVAFRLGPSVGDLLFIKAEVVKIGIKSLTVQVNVRRELADTGELQEVCIATFGFVTVNKARKAIPHGLELKGK